MRVAVVSVSGFTLLAAVACFSPESSDDARDLARAASLRSALANAGALTDANGGVVSALELSPTATLTAARQGSQRDPNSSALGAPASVGTHAVANVNRKTGKSSAAIRPDSDKAALEKRIATVKVPTPTFVVAPAIGAVAVRPEPAVIPAPKNPGSPAGTGPYDADGGGAAGGPNAERPRPNPEVIDSPPPTPSIIRGGVITGRDPCAIHRPVPTGPIAVNDRLPTRPAGVGGVRPGTAGGIGSIRTGSGRTNRGGSRFPGGIR